MTRNTRGSFVAMLKALANSVCRCAGKARLGSSLRGPATRAHLPIQLLPGSCGRRHLELVDFRGLARRHFEHQIEDRLLFDYANLDELHAVKPRPASIAKHPLIVAGVLPHVYYGRWTLCGMLYSAREARSCAPAPVRSRSIHLCAEIQSGQPVPIVALTGFMGAGKSSVGRALASLLRWSFVDLDHEIELRQNQQIRDLFQSQGEPRFRDIETSTLKTLIGHLSSATVIALGGGTFIQEPNIVLLRACSAKVVFLEASVELMMQRCQVGTELPNDNPRPLASDPDAFQALYARRLSHYRAADLTVITDNLTFDQQAQEIAARLKLIPGAP